MAAAIELGRQTGAERPAWFDVARDAANETRKPAASQSHVLQPTSDVHYLHKQSSPAFPRPKTGFAPHVALLTVVGTIAAFFWLHTADSGSVWLASLMVPIVFVVVSVFVLPRLRGSLDRKSRHRGLGTVLMTDRAGVVLGEDAQQRGLIEVETGGERFLFVAAQHGLALSPGDSVQVSWSREASETCFVHRD